MKRRFVVTLLAVAAVAVLSAKANAMAPVINYIPSPVIADDVPATSARLFIYPDALDLNTLATDDTVTSNAIIWSYTGTGRYTLNARQPLNLGTDDPNHPGTKEVGGAGLDDDVSALMPQDSNVRTVTFRDSTLTPIGSSTGTDPMPGTTATQIVHSEVVTLFASDGSTFSQRSVMVYTENNGTDRLSGGWSLSRDSSQTPSSAGASAWTTTSIGGLAVPTLNDTGSALCIGAVASPISFGGWVSPYNYISLVQNNVYRIRLSVNSNGATLPAGTAPLWDILVDNYNGSAAGGGDQKYNGDLMNFDNEGSANAVQSGNTNMDMWYTPLPVTAADWNDGTTGEFSAGKDANNDMRLQFRVNNTGVSTGRAGTVCLTNITVDRVPISDIPVAKNLYDQSNLTSSNFTVGAIFGVNGSNNTLATFSGGHLTLTPNPAVTGAWNVEVINVDMGDATVNLSNGATLVDNWPIPWESDKLLRGTLTVQAPDAQGASNPPDAIAALMDEPTSELTMASTISAGANLLGLPKQSTTTDYTVFMYTNNKSTTSIQNGAALRLRGQVLLTQNINSGGSATNTGGVTFTRFRVDEMVPPAN